MEHSDFVIGQEFWCSGRWLCTDIGRRVVVAVRVDEQTVVCLELATGIKTSRILDTAEAERDGWFNGPPYAVAETVFDEYDFETYTLTAEEELSVKI